jgi:hypothetical protein
VSLRGGLSENAGAARKDGKAAWFLPPAEKDGGSGRDSGTWPSQFAAVIAAYERFTPARVGDGMLQLELLVARQPREHKATTAKQGTKISCGPGVAWDPGVIASLTGRQLWRQTSAKQSHPNEEQRRVRFPQR